MMVYNDKKFWTLTSDGTEILRDLKNENKHFTRELYKQGKFDANNYQWYEMFHHFVYDDNGCDYERYGCFIKDGDVVLDLGANIGIFAHRAETRGASKVICFEPITPTFGCLMKNKGPNTIVYKNAVGNKNCFSTFNIHTDYTHIGGGQEFTMNNTDKKIIYSEKVIVVDINEIFRNFHYEINFMKIDIEGGEVEVLNHMSDESILSLRCLSAEFHKINDEFDTFQSNFCNRMNDLGFNHFIVYHGDGNLRTATYWKR